MPIQPLRPVVAYYRPWYLKRNSEAGLRQAMAWYAKARMGWPEPQVFIIEIDVPPGTPAVPKLRAFMRETIRDQYLGFIVPTLTHLSTDPKIAEQRLSKLRALGMTVMPLVPT